MLICHELLSLVPQLLLANLERVFLHVVIHKLYVNALLLRASLIPLLRIV